MKTTINKYRHAIILLMIVLNSVVAYATAPWTVEPGDYRYDMTLYLKVTFLDEEMDYSLYEVGIFCGDECRGVAEVLNLSNGKDCLYLRARSNVENGETMTFKYYNKETEKVFSIDNPTIRFQSNTRLGYPSDPFLIEIVQTYTLGDVNGDGKTTVGDVVSLVNCIIGNKPEFFIDSVADVNGDGKLSVGDVVTLVNTIINKQ